MILAVLLFVGFVAILATAAALMTFDDGVAIMMGVTGFISWAIVSFGALNLQIVRDATVYQFEAYILTLFTAMLSLIPLYIALTGPMELIGSRVRGPRQDEV